MKEAYVSFEVARLLKEKGFDWTCITYYVDYEPNDVKYSMLFEDNTTWEERCCSAPTHQMACAWLREKYLIHVYAEHKAFFQEKPRKLYYHWIPFVKTLPHCPINKSGFTKDTISLDVYCNTYEDAVEAALKYSLENLI